MGTLNQQQSVPYASNRLQADSDPVSSVLAAMLESAPLQPQGRNVPATLKPDYSALVEVLTNLYRIPDGLGETILRPHEAAAVRRRGFAARAGVTCAARPCHTNLVCWNPLLRHLSTGRRCTSGCNFRKDESRKLTLKELKNSTSETVERDLDLPDLLVASLRQHQATRISEQRSTFMAMCTMRRNGSRQLG
jgi:hypothetical protein